MNFMQASHFGPNFFAKVWIQYHRFLNKSKIQCISNIDNVYECINVQYKGILGNETYMWE